MKKVIILGTYPNTKEHLDCLEECIDLLSEKDYDLIVTSHYPVPPHIQNKVDYLIYDKENCLLPYNLTPYSWMSNESFYMQVNARGHQVAICRNMRNGIAMANSLGYDIFFFMEADNLISEDDFEIFDSISKDMIESNKECIFFKNIQEGNEVYETLIFGGHPDYFLNKIPSNIEEYIEWVSVDGKFFSEPLEKTFYRKFDKNDIFLIEENSKNTFKSSIINKYSGSDYLCEVIKNNMNKQYVLFLKNFGEKVVNFRVDGVDNIINPLCWSYRFVLDGSEISVLIYEDGEIVGRKHFIVNEDNKIHFDEKGFLEFR